MAKHSLKLLLLRKYRTNRNYFRQFRQKTKSLLPVTGSESNFSLNTHTHEPESVSAPSSIRRKRKYVNNSVDTVDCCELICDCIGQYKLRTFVSIVIIGILSTTGIYYHNQRILQYSIYRDDVFSPAHGIRLKRCSIPELKPFSVEVRKFISYTTEPHCLHEQRSLFPEPPFTLKNGSYLIKNPNLEIDLFKGCCYRPFHRSGDQSVWSSNHCADISNEEITIIPNEFSYIEILCINSGTETDFRDGFALIQRKSQVEDRVEDYEEHTKENKSRLNVVILGLDATSQMNFIRAMPKSNRFLAKNLSAILLKGYTKVAENTLPNVVPLLTGKTLDEFKRECVDESLGSAHVHLDNCHFIWRLFETNGFRTAFSEDDVDIGIFNMNWPNAFVRPPTDYYLRPYSILMQRHHSFRNGFCYGPNLSFEKLLENIRSVAEVFKDESFFHFTWSTKLSHDDFNKMRWGDEPLLNFLEYLHTNDVLNNTALFVVGDHGSRLDRIRSTTQGKLEDRMPIAYIALPDWFKTKYTRAYNNLVQNADRVTSAFDLHKTFHTFLNLDNLLLQSEYENDFWEEDGEDLFFLPNNDSVALGKFRGASLFHELPINRTCFSAGIPLHWCVCHKKIPKSKDSDIGKDAAEYVVNSLNILLENHHNCATLVLHSVDEVSKWDPSEIIAEGCEEKFNKSDNATDKNTTTTASHSRAVGSSNTERCNSPSDVIVWQVAFTTSPSKATFETTVIQLEDGRWRITEDVVRTNSYEGQSSCVEQKLKPYCYCMEDESSVFDGLF